MTSWQRDLKKGLSNQGSLIGLNSLFWKENLIRFVHREIDFKTIVCKPFKLTYYEIQGYWLMEYASLDHQLVSVLSISFLKNHI